MSTRRAQPKRNRIADTLPIALVSGTALVITWLSLFLSTLAYASSPYEVTDSFGKHQFEIAPKRVVVTDWTLLEQLLSLDVVPVGAPEIEAYEAYEQHTAVPDSVLDIGLRRAPSFDAIRALEPDLIILGTDQKDLERAFSRIARVMYFHNFSERFASNGEKAMERLSQLAVLFQKEEQGDAINASVSNHIDLQRARLEAYFSGEPPEVTIVRPLPTGQLVAYGENSLLGYVSDRLGLGRALEQDKNKLGEVAVSSSTLGKLDRGYLLVINSANSRQSPTVERRLPLTVGADAQPWDGTHFSKLKVIEIDDLWPYGGAAALASMADIITYALLQQQRD
ncbi:MAG: ABC transporter substrate-binding protein [Pseudomonadota bacterium]